MDLLEAECLCGGQIWFGGGVVFSLGGIGAGGFSRDKILGRKADFMLVEWVWWRWRHVLVRGGGGFCLIWWRLLAELMETE